MSSAPNRFGLAWLAERGDREAIKVRYPWGFDGSSLAASHSEADEVFAEDCGEISCLTHGDPLASPEDEAEEALEFTFSADWAR